MSFSSRQQRASRWAIIVIAFAGLWINPSDQARTVISQTKDGANRIEQGEIALSSGKSIEIAGNKRHSYRIPLSSGRFARITLDKNDLGLIITLSDPYRRKLAELKRRPFRPASLSLICKKSGAYILEAQSLGGGEYVGHYELRLEQRRVPTPQDRDRIIAEAACAEGDKLRDEWNAESFLKAITSYEKARAYHNRLGDQREVAHILKSIGDVYLALSQNKKALDYYDQALSLSRDVKDRYLEIDAMNGVASIKYDLIEAQDDIQSVLDYCNQAIAFSKEIGYRRGEAQALDNLGLVAYASNDMQKALELLDQAMTIWQAAGDRRGQAETLNNKGYIYGDLGDTSAALRHFNQSLALWRDVGDRRGESLALTALGVGYTLLGERQKAFDVHTQALEVFQLMGDHSGEAVTLNGLAYVYDSLGETQKALDTYLKAARLFREAGRGFAEAVTVGLVGKMCHSLGKHQEALAYYSQKLEIVRSLKDQRAQAYTLRDIGNVYGFLGQAKQAFDYYRRALSINQSLNDRRGQAYTLNNIGYLYDKTGEKQKALEAYNRALSFMQATQDRGGETIARHNIARIKRDLGDLTGAYGELASLLEVVETQRANINSEEMRASYFATAHQHYELFIDVLMQMHKREPSAGYDATALEASERARARSLLDLLVEASVDIRQGVESSLLQQERDLQNLLNAKAEKQIQMLNGKHTEQQSEEMRDEIAHLTSKYEAVRSKIRATSPRYAALTQPQALGLQEIQREALDDDTLILEYSLGDERSYCWAITRNSLTSFELPGRDDITKLARLLYDSIISQSRASKADAPQQPSSQETEEVAARLGEILLGPISSQLGKRRLVIVCDGALQYVPFAALSDPDSAALNGGRQPLMVDHEIVSLPSLSTLAVLRKEIAGRSPAPKALAVLADPVFEKYDARVKTIGRATKSKPDNVSEAPGEISYLTQALVRSAIETGTADEKLRFTRLPFAWEEAKAISGLMPESEIKLALNFEANHSTAVSAELARYRIIHFATHGLLNTLHPELSGVVLSLVDRDGKAQDGFLRLNEVYNLRLPAELVVLSACQTALGKEIKGEGLVSLTRGFMYAGAARVVASLWRVDDRASAEFMRLFYQAMFGPQRLNPAKALKAAQVAMWKQQRWKPAYYWAAFVLQGEWK